MEKIIHCSVKNSVILRFTLNPQILKRKTPKSAPAPIWRRYRFKTSSTDDYRPVVFDPKYPWWCSGFSVDSAIIIAYLPSTENIRKYWPEAEDEEYTEEKQITFTSRFPKPQYFIES